MKHPGARSVDRAAAVSALLLVAAAPPSPLPLLILGALAPLIAAVARLPVGEAGRRQAFRAGAIHGALAWGLLLLWILRAGPRVGAWVVPGWISIVGTMSVVSGLAGIAVHRLAVERRVPLPLAAALGWGGVEWLRAVGLGPLSFPWMGLAVPLTAVPALIQGGAWVGEVGLALGVAGLNGLLASALLASGGVRRRRLAAAAAVVVLVAVLGQVRMARAGLRPFLRVLVLQPAVPLEVKRSDADLALAASLDAVGRLVEAAAGPGGAGADVAILPETAVPVALDAPASTSVRGTVAGWSRALGIPVVVGAWARGKGRGGNAVFLASSDPEAAWPAAWKQRLVPGVEWIPGSPDAVEAGSTDAVLTLPGGLALAPLVCIESAGPRPALDLVRAGGDVLVNVTNDAWLAEEPWWTRTAAFLQHPAHLALRAVETGTGAVRVGNNGRTEVVDPLGRRRLLLRPHRPGHAVAEVVGGDRPTPFTRLGPWAGHGALLALVLLSLAPPLRRGAPR